jgi:cysteine synthase
VPDERRTISTEDGLAMCAEVMATNGLFIGHSAGAALQAARDVSQTLASGVVVVLFPDGGDRYLSGGRA